MIGRRALLIGGCAAFAACRFGKERGHTGARDSGQDSAVDSAVDSTADNDSGQSTATCEETSTSVDGWIEIPLANIPEVETVGGFAYVELPDQLINVIVVQVSEGCYTALWRICTHGACETDWNAAAAEAVCPCHGSVFATDGTVVEGPATRGLRVFKVVQRGSSLWLQR